MALSMEDMARGVIQPEVLTRVQAGMMNRCYLAYAAADNADAGLQIKRITLCGRVTAEPALYVTNFCWLVMAVTTVTSLDAAALTDTVITSCINQANWDMMADLLVPS